MQRKLGFAASKTVSKLRKFKSVSEAQLKELQQTCLKKRTYAKMRWCV